MAEVVYFSQDVCCDCSGAIDFLQVDVLADGVPVSSQRVPASPFTFAANSGAKITMTVTPVVDDKLSESCITRTFVAPEELGPARGTMLGSLTVDRKHVLEADL